MMRPLSAPGPILRNFSLILGGEVLGQLIAFAAGIYLARALGVEGFGVLVLAASIVLYLQIFVDGGTEVWGMREVGARPDRLREAAGSILALRLCLAAVVAVVLAVAAVVAGPEQRWALLAGLVSIAAFALQTNWAHRALESAAPAAATLLQRLLFLALAIAFVRAEDQAPRAILLQGGAEMFAALLLLLLLLPRLRGGSLAIRGASIVALLRAAWPFCAARGLRNLPIVVMTAALSFFLMDAQTGYFGAALRVATLLLVVSSAFGLATFPALSRAGAIGGETELKVVAALMRLLALVVMPVAIGGLLLAPPMVEFLFTRAFAPASLPLQVLLVSMLLQALSDNLRRVLHVRHRQHEDLTYVAGTTGLALLSAALLLPLAGALGASAALAIGEVALLVLAWRAVYRGEQSRAAFVQGFAAAAAVSALVAACALAGRLLLPFPAAASVVALVYLIVLWSRRLAILHDFATLGIDPTSVPGGLSKSDDG